MGLFLLSFVQILRDIALAVFDIVMRRRRRCYRHAVTIAAPVAGVKADIDAEEVTYDNVKMRVLSEPVGDSDSRFLRTTIFIDGKPYSRSLSEKIETGDPNRFQYRFHGAESDHPELYGEDDTLTVEVEAVGPEQTRMRYARELSHRRPRTRITAPMGLRQAAWLAKTKAEADFKGGGSGRSFGAKVGSQVFWAGLALASFAYIAGWQDAIILMVLILLHELGHAAAMLMVGVGVGFVRFVPFFGGMAAPKRAYASEWQHAIVALAGPGLSLIPTALLTWYAYQSGNHLVATAAMLFALINGFNLLPIVPLDGGIVLRSLLGSIHPALGPVVSWIGAGLVLAAAIYLKSILIGIIFAFAVIQVVSQASFDLGRRRRLGWFEGAVVLVGFVVSLGLYAWLGVLSVQLLKITAA